MNKFFSPAILEAKAEAQRVVLRRQQEAELEFIDVPDYVAPSEMNDRPVVSEKKSKTSGKSKKSKKSNNNNSNYQGKKK